MHHGATNWVCCPVLHVSWGYARALVYMLLMLLMLSPVICSLDCCPPINEPIRQVGASAFLLHPIPDSPDMPTAPVPHIIGHMHCAFTVVNTSIALIALAVIARIVATRQTAPPRFTTSPALPPP